MNHPFVDLCCDLARHETGLPLTQAPFQVQSLSGYRLYVPYAEKSDRYNASYAKIDPWTGYLMHYAAQMHYARFYVNQPGIQFKSE